MIPTTTSRSSCATSRSGGQRWTGWWRSRRICFTKPAHSSTRCHSSYTAKLFLRSTLARKQGAGAYLAVFHAAQALIHKRTGREAKTRRGVHVQFARLTKDDAHFDTQLRQFLSQAYDLKTLADYATGLEAAGRRNVPPRRSQPRIGLSM
jgi:uncharacterized protein (UPF0332 family)